MNRRSIDSLYDDGFVVLPGIVPDSVWKPARRELIMKLGELHGGAMGYSPARPAGLTGTGGLEDAVEAMRLVGGSPEVCNLFSSVQPLLEQALGGPLESPKGGQMALNFPTNPGPGINETGWRDDETPWYGWGGHVDGVWNGGIKIPQSPDISEEDVAAWYSDPSTNGGTRFYPADLGHGEDCCMTNFTVLVGIPLSDMSQEGTGNVGLMRASHHDMEQFLQKQHALGGPMGPSGPEWPREYLNARNGHGLCHYPPEVREKACQREGVATTEDGHRWPRPTLVKCKPGDAVLILYHTLHSSTRVDSPDPRCMVYFRITQPDRPAGHGRIHPAALRDMWSEWPGIAEAIAEKKKAAGLTAAVAKL